MAMQRREDYQVRMENIRHLPPTQFSGVTIIFMIP